MPLLSDVIKGLMLSRRDHTNYQARSMTLKMYLHGRDMEGHIDGTDARPSPMVIQGVQRHMVDNHVMAIIS